MKNKPQYYIEISNRETCETIKVIDVNNVERIATEGSTIRIRYTDGFWAWYDTNECDVFIKLNNLNYDCRHL